MATAAKTTTSKTQPRKRKWKVKLEPMTPFLRLRVDLAQREYDAGLAIPAKLGWEMLKKLDQGAA